MNKDEFLIKMKELIQSEQDLDMTTNLLDIDEWDSLSIMSVIAFIDENFNIKLSFDEIHNMDTLERVFERIHK